MFETTGSLDRPLLVQASAWQCFKAGAAFTAGALLVTFVAGILYWVAMVRILPLIMMGPLRG